MFAFSLICGFWLHFCRLVAPFGDLFGRLGRPFGTLGPPFEPLDPPVGLPGAPSWASESLLGRPWAPIWASIGRPDPHLRPFGGNERRLDLQEHHFGTILAPFGTILEYFWSNFAYSWRSMLTCRPDPSHSALGRCHWHPAPLLDLPGHNFETILDRCWSYLGCFWKSLWLYLPSELTGLSNFNS